MPCPTCTFCGRCGRDVSFAKDRPEGLCIFCNHVNPPEAVRCENCGKKMPLPPGTRSGNSPSPDGPEAAEHRS